MNINKIIGKYQIFSGASFWIGFGRFNNGMGLILDWQLGLGWIRINKYL
jgi:hypothetical protein